jgi:hypothetical protein
MSPEKARNLREYLESLSKSKEYKPEYLMHCMLDAIQAVEEGHTNGDMSDAACYMYLFLKDGGYTYIPT